MAQHAGRVGDLAAYAAAALAAASAAVSLYWALGGRALLATVGEQVVRMADEGGGVAQAALLLVAAVKLVGAALALALVRPWGRRLPQRLLVVLALAGGVVLTQYGGVLVVVGALVLGGVIGPPPADDTALRWHVYVWDAWFLLWGLALLIAAIARRAKWGLRAKSA